MKKTPDAAVADEGGSMPVTGHLKELRNRVAVVLVVFIAANILFLSNAEKLTTFLTNMGASSGYNFVFISPQELLMQYFKISLLASFCLTVPLILFEIWGFAKPGLTAGESRGMAAALVCGLACFCLGVFFAYRVTLPFMLGFLIKLGVGTTFTATISVESYISFVLLVFVIFGVIFEMPLLSVVLSRMGLLSPSLLKKARPAAIVLIFVVAALITPPDIFSQIMVAIPMVLLYQVSILLSGIFARKKKPSEASEDE